DPDSPAALQARARLAVRAREADAQQHVAAVLSRDPESELGLLMQGSLAFRRRRADEAANAFGQAAMLNPENTSAAKAARGMRGIRHPRGLPGRQILRRGGRGARILYIAVVAALIALHQHALETAFIAYWVAFVLVLPRLLRRHYRRRYGSL